MTDIEFRPYRTGDERAILDTFNLTFRAVSGVDFVDRTLARWRWEFAANPAGMRIMLGVAEDGRVACQYAGVPMRVWTTTGGGRTLSFFHAVDSMVHVDFRRGLRKRGLFVEVAERFFDAYGGKLDHLGFGYPVRPAWRIGERYLGYRLVRTLDFLRRPVGAAPARSEVEVEVRSIERFSDSADALFLELRHRFACVTVKDARYLNWRYADCPDVGYHLLWAMRSAKPVGWAVLRVEGALAPGAATIGDLWLDPDDSETLRALIDHADVLAQRAGCTHLMTVQNPALALARGFGELGFVPEPSSTWLERKLGSRDWTSGLSQEWLAENWSYTLGDSDLF